jgi:hypothetical protein
VFFNLDTRILKSLINFLCTSGVYVYKNDKCSTLTQVLSELLLEESQRKWTQDQLNEAHNSLPVRDTFRSLVLRNALVCGLNYKVLKDPTIRKNLIASPIRLTTPTAIPSPPVL